MIIIIYDHTRKWPDVVAFSFALGYFLPCHAWCRSLDGAASSLLDGTEPISLGGDLPRRSPFAPLRLLALLLRPHRSSRSAAVVHHRRQQGGRQRGRYRLRAGSHQEGTFLNFEASRPDTLTRTLLTYAVQVVSEYPCVVFMKGTPDAPQCGFSNATIKALNTVGTATIKITLRLRVSALLRWI